MKPHKAEDETRVGDVLLRMGTITQTQLTDAVKRQRTGDTRPLGVLLMDLGYADAHSVQLALLRQQALRGQLSQDDNLRLLEEAREKAEAMGNSLSELTAAAEKREGLVGSSSLLSEKWQKRARKLNPFYRDRLGWSVPSGWPADVGGDDFAECVAVMQEEHGALTVDGILGPKTLASMKGNAFVPPIGEHLIIGGRRVAVPFPVVTWEDPSGLSFYSKGGWSKRKDTTGKGINLFVLHWDGCTSAHQCFHVLLERKLSVHLMLDGDGTVYQALDLAEARAWHGSEVNERSVGIEIQNPVRLHRNQWQKPPRTVVKEAGVHGDVPYERLDFYDIQKQRVVQLADALCAHMGISRQLPLDANGQVLQTLMPKGFQGVCGHYHVSKQKPDPGLTLWPGLKRAFETSPIPNV